MSGIPLASPAMIQPTQEALWTQGKDRLQHTHHPAATKWSCTGQAKAFQPLCGSRSRVLESVRRYERKDPGTGTSFYLITLMEKSSFQPSKEDILRTSLVVQWLRLWAPTARVLGSIPGRGTRSHMWRLGGRMPQWRWKMPWCAKTKIRGRQINKYFLKNFLKVKKNFFFFKRFFPQTIFVAKQSAR